VSSVRNTLRAAVGVFAALVVLGLVFPDSLFGLVTDTGTAEAALRLAVPITLAALGGIFAEKSGVINIGLEGLLIVSAFAGVAAVKLLGTGSSVGPIPSIWVAFLVGVLASTLLALLFAVVCIEFEADQIIAGLAVWLVALGIAPFASVVLFGTKNVQVSTLGDISIPVLSTIPYFGDVVFSANVIVYMMFVAVPACWYVLNRTQFGRWVEASGENPSALDTAGVSVDRVRYASVLISGVLAGIGGAALSLGHVGAFTAGGATMVNGKGFIAIATYLFGNYNPLGTLVATLLFSGLDSLQIGLQQAGIAIPSELVQTIPYVTVIVVLVFVGRTRIPAAAGDHYDSGEDSR